MDEETVSVPYTCGVCETTFDKTELLKHPCLLDYNKCQIDANFYVYPALDDGKILHKSLVDSAEIIVTETSKVPNQKTNASNWRNIRIIEEERLIDEICKRPPLWNFKLPLIERSLQIKKKLWEEVTEAMDGKMDIITIKKRWKYLCDTFRNHKNKQHQPSGSAGISRQKNWIHYERMQFLDDVQLES
ncbi:PREDICTED: uncharacterized protein LOC105556194, partial [Vollenhovia emeryi]|uniref:uncharacterized protein LOC105556194 n=1 Tax=Vollenhovia emeryi TaxID=411798 RepID=UPI0005F4B985